MSRLPKSLEFDLPGCFIAGGAILSIVTKTEINDYDVYPKTNSAMIDAFYSLINDYGCFVVNITDRAVTFKSNSTKNDKGERAIVQVMTYDTFETAEKIFQNFDFTVCMGAFDCDTKSYAFHDDFYPDIACRALRFNPKTRYPLNSLIRVTKYQNKGFFASKPEHVRMILTTIERGLPNSWEELESQIGGTYGRQISLLRDDIPFSFESAIELLSDIGEFHATDETYDVCPEDLEDMFSDELKNVVVNDEDNYFLVKDGKINRSLGKLKPKKCVVVNENDVVRFYGYKVLHDLGDGRYGPGVQVNSKVEYRIGEETSCTTSPYLFVFPEIPNKSSMFTYGGKKKKVGVIVSYGAKDIRKINNNEIQVTKLKVESKLEEM